LEFTSKELYLWCCCRGRPVCRGWSSSRSRQPGTCCRRSR